MRLMNDAPQKGFRYAKHFFFGSGWGRPKIKVSKYKQWKFIWKCRSKRVIGPLPNMTLPEGIVIHNAKEVASEYFENEEWESRYIWPYTQVFPKGHPHDPNYKNNPAMVFDRRSVILEGFKGAMNFTNTICCHDAQLPQIISNYVDDIEIEESMLKLMDKRIFFSRVDDGICIKLPKVLDFPKLNVHKMNEFGIPPHRREANTLSTFFDIAELISSQKYGFFDMRRISSPACFLCFNRDNRLQRLDLRCDFITCFKNEAIQINDDQKIDSVAETSPLFSDSWLSSKDIPLPNISPANWEICFENSHYYKVENRFRIPQNAMVHCIALSTNFQHSKKMVDRFLKARAVMFCYGYAVAQARLLFGNFHDHTDLVNKCELSYPITLNCVFINESKNSLSFASFQLNTLGFDSEVKNQIWFDGPFDIDTERVDILRRLIALNGYYTKSNILKQKNVLQNE